MDAMNLLWTMIRIREYSYTGTQAYIITHARLIRDTVLRTYIGKHFFLSPL